jgi:hypothetical protein
MLEILIMLFLATVALGWSLYLVVYVVLATADVFHRRRRAKDEARQLAAEREWRSKQRAGSRIGGFSS